MSLRIQSSFSAGELDPALHERTTLEKYHAALATARNVFVGKTGRLVSRAGRKLFRKCKLNNRKVIIHPLSNLGGFLEWGHLYVRYWILNPESWNTELVADYVHDFTESDLPNIQFVDVAFGKIAVFLPGKAVKLLQLTGTMTPGFITEADIFDIPVGPTIVGHTTSVPGTSYDVDYVITTVIDGQESTWLELLNGTSYVGSAFVGKFPVAAGEYVNLVVDCGYASQAASIQEIRVYRRPKSAGAYGYIGSSSSFVDTGGSPNKRQCAFKDVGMAADYTHIPPTLNQTIRNLGLTDPTDLEGQSGCLYQQRLLMSRQDQIMTSRVGYPFNFMREFPLTADGSLSFKMGTKGNVNIIHMINSDGLVVFTYDGVYLHTGALSPTNLSMEKKGSWVIDPIVPPIAIPGGVLFVDSLTNVVRQLLWSQEAGTYIAEEMSIFSNHLFENVTIKSWAFQDGNFPLLWIIFSDGTYASFTYEREHQMRAWTRHDSGFGLEYVAATTKGGYFVSSTLYPLQGEVIFVSNVNGQRYIELGVERYATPQQLEDNPEADMGRCVAALDSMSTWSYVLDEERFSSGVVPVVLTLAKIGGGGWDDELTLTCDTAIFGNGVTDNDGEQFVVGTVFRHFNPEDKTAVDLEVTSVTSNKVVVVQPSALFPSEYAAQPRLYLTKNVLSKQVSFHETIGAGLYTTDLNTYLAGQIFTVTPKVGGVWNGTLKIDSGTTAVFTTAHDVKYGDLLYYKTDGGVWIEMYITEVTTNKLIEVMPSSTFPSGEASDIILNKRLRFHFSLDHLEDESVAIISDGYVVASPNNNIDTYSTVTVADGTVTLPSSLRGAIVHVGRPFVMDIETLDIDTVEQHPVLLESKTINKLYIKVLNSRGLFVSSKFPATDVLTGMSTSGLEEVTMEDTDTIPMDYEDPIIANRYPRPRTKRVEITLPGDWKSQGRICVRQVDPVHFEILSITPDLEELKRSR